MEKLPKLLNHTCCQSVRPAWKSAKVLDTPYESIKPKEPRFEQCEVFRLEWKSRNSPKDSWFCSNCGCLENIMNPSGKCEHLHFPEYTISTAKRFPKILGYGEITEILKIEIRKGGITFFDAPNMENIENFAKQDGFNNLDDMLAWFEKRYDLNTPKPFFVYRWKYIQEDRNTYKQNTL
jgi:hypothetical protein